MRRTFARKQCPGICQKCIKRVIKDKYHGDESEIAKLKNKPEHNSSLRLKSQERAGIVALYIVLGLVDLGIKPGESTNMLIGKNCQCEVNDEDEGNGSVDKVG